VARIEEEMKKLLTSIIGIDKYKYFIGISPEKKNLNYDFEMHLIFDNAFEEGLYNEYVELLIDILHKNGIQICERFETPYGELLTWILKDGKTKIKCHLKDREKVKIKKRWSQILYFFNILELEEFSVVENLNRADIYKKGDKKKHKNTFVLALDGDSSFAADSITILLDHLVADPNLGALCGRIHPEGSGLLYWYQKFEYGLGHWLQKSTEDMLGNVLAVLVAFQCIDSMH